MKTTTTLTEIETMPFWADVLAIVPEYQRKTVDRLYNQAIAYVWGRQDTGESIRDTDASQRFAAVYGRHAAAFACGLIGFRRNHQDAYILWTHGDDLNTTEI